MIKQSGLFPLMLAYREKRSFWDKPLTFTFFKLSQHYAPSSSFSQTSLLPRYAGGNPPVNNQLSLF